jgi:hypothetical protein
MELRTRASERWSISAAACPGLRTVAQPTPCPALPHVQTSLGSSTNCQDRTLRSREARWSVGILENRSMTGGATIPPPYESVSCVASDLGWPVDSRMPLKVGIGLGSVLAAAVIACIGLVVSRREG